MRLFLQDDQVSGRAAAVAAAATFALLGAGFAVAAPGGGHGGSPGGVNNGGNSPSGGNASCVTGTPEACRLNPTGQVKACDPVPGNGCHRLPATPCERGHGNVKAKNKHCGPASPPVTPPGGGSKPPGGGPPPPGGSTPAAPAPGPAATANPGVSGVGGVTTVTSPEGSLPAGEVRGERVSDSGPAATRRATRGVAAPARAVVRSARFAG